MTDIYTDTTFGRLERRYAANHESIARMHAAKNADYGEKDRDPYTNFRMSADVGVEPWRGAVVRLLDKVSRIKTFCKSGSLANESFEDSLDDLANYALIVKSLFQEAKQDESDKAAALLQRINSTSDHPAATPFAEQWHARFIEQRGLSY